MDLFLLIALAVVLIALAIYVAASLRLERARRIREQCKPSHIENSHK